MIRNHFISLILIMTLPTLAAPVKLVKDGQAQAVIVIPEKAIYPVRYAAKELQYHIEKSSGAKLPVYSETDRLPSGASVIYLGNTRAASKAGLNTETLAPAEYILKEINGSLYLLGKDRSLRNGIRKLNIIAEVGGLRNVIFLQKLPVHRDRARGIINADGVAVIKKLKQRLQRVVTIRTLTGNV